MGGAMISPPAAPESTKPGVEPNLEPNSQHDSYQSVSNAHQPYCANDWRPGVPVVDVTFPVSSQHQLLWETHAGFGVYRICSDISFGCWRSLYQLLQTLATLRFCMPRREAPAPEAFCQPCLHKQ